MKGIPAIFGSGLLLGGFYNGGNIPTWFNILTGIGLGIMGIILELPSKEVGK